MLKEDPKVLPEHLGDERNRLYHLGHELCVSMRQDLKWLKSKYEMLMEIIDDIQKIDLKAQERKD